MLTTTTARAYYPDGLLQSETTTYADAVARTVGYTYDGDGNRETVTYPRGRIFGYEYNGRNLMEKITENGITWVEYLYDLNGNRRERRLFNNLMRTAYGVADANNRIPSLSHTFTGGDTARFDYGFDDVNRLRYEQRDSAKADGYAYGKADQVVGFNREGTLQANGTVTSAADVLALNFDANGNRTSVVNDGVTRVYAAANNLNQYPSVGGVPATYDANGNLATYNGWIA